MGLCEFCGNFFKRPSELQRHIGTFHTNVISKIRCDICMKWLHKQNMHKHMLTHKSPVVVPSQQQQQDRVQAVPAVVQPSTSAPSRMCADCLVEVECSKWSAHLRTLVHRRKSAVLHQNGFKVVKSSFGRRIETLIFENSADCLDPVVFLERVESQAIPELKRQLGQHSAYKFNVELFGEYVKMTHELEEFSIKSFQTRMEVVLNERDILPLWEKMREQVLVKMQEFQSRDSGWTLVSILDLELNINEYKPIRGSNYIALPLSIRRKHACINVKNNDVFCFKWAIISALSPVAVHSDRVNSYHIADIHSNVIVLDNQKIVNFGQLEYPLKVTDVSVFESLNDTISVNVFGLEDEHIVGPFYHTKAVRETHLNLLFLQQDARHHYVWIKDISRLIGSQVTKHHGQMYLCNFCLIHFGTHALLAAHANECGKIVTRLPSPDSPQECKLKFDKVQRQVEVPFVIYADFECLLKNFNVCTPNPAISSTTNVQQHVPCAFAYKIVCSYDSSLNRMKVYKGVDSPKEFVLSLAADVRDIYNSVLMRPKGVKPLTEQEEIFQRESPNCHICKNKLGSDRVLDHCHLTGNYRGPAHNECNLLYRVPKFFPIFFHNFSGYDCHLFVKALDVIPGRINIIPLNKELYVSLSKWISVDDDESETVELRFLDSIRFMQGSLEALAQNLSPADFENVRATFPDASRFKLITKKGVLPYEYLDSWTRLEETALPTRVSFDNKLTKTACSDEDYEHAVKVWDTFNCKTLWDYLRVYLVTDVLLLTDIFQNFRKLCYRIYSLDPCQYYTVPGLTWDAMLKCTGIELDLLTDISMYQFIRRALRGGLCQCSHRHSVANNKYMGNYDASKESSYLMYLDVNNLYGWAMNQSLPYGNFEWIENVDAINVMDISENSDVGYIFEVDLSYPQSLHREHNDLPFCAENKCSPSSTLPKLIADLTDKKNYVIHYRNLQQCLRFGLKLTKVHRAIRFSQSCWLKKYIDLNTFHRTNAANDFEKNFFKLLNNAVYGKTMENVDKRRDVRIVTQWESFGRRLGARALIAKPHFHSATQFTPDMVAVQLNRVRTFYNKPIYLGFIVLELSKWLMYDFHYGYMKPKYCDDNLVLNYMDTDSFIYSVRTEDFYDDIKLDIDQRFDTSEYSSANPFGIPLVNRKKVGLMKDENNGRIMREFIGLRSKMYSVDVVGSKLIKKAKGIKRTAVNELSLDNYRDCLYKKKIFYSSMLTFRTHVHNIYTQHINKVSLSFQDDKRCIREDGVATFAWGHYLIDEF